jgi:hypothetical protein
VAQLTADWRPNLRFGIVTWMLVIAALALPMHALRVAHQARTGEAKATACIAVLLGVLGLGSALVATDSRGRPRAIGATWSVVGFQAIGLAVPEPLDILLMPLGLVAGMFLFLWLTGHIDL